MQQRVYVKRVNDVDELCQRLLSVWHSIGQNVIDEAIDQWRARLNACVRAKGGHFEHLMWNRRELNVSTVTWHFESVLNWIWPCCICTHLTFQVSQGSVATEVKILTISYSLIHFVYSSEKITKIGQYLSELSKK